MLNHLIEPEDFNDEKVECPRCGRIQADSFSVDGRCDECAQEVLSSLAGEEDPYGIEECMVQTIDYMIKSLEAVLA